MADRGEAHLLPDVTEEWTTYTTTAGTAWCRRIGAAVLRVEPIRTHPPHPLDLHRAYVESDREEALLEGIVGRERAQLLAEQVAALLEAA